MAVHLLIAGAMVALVDHTWFLMETQAGRLTGVLRWPMSVASLPLLVGVACIVYTSLVHAWACAIHIATGVRPVICLPLEEDEFPGVEYIE